MTGWMINLWQRLVFALAALILLAHSLYLLGNEDDPLISFIWAVIFAAVSVAPRSAKATQQ